MLRWSSITLAFRIDYMLPFMTAADESVTKRGTEGGLSQSFDADVYVLINVSLCSSWELYDATEGSSSLLS